MLKAAPAWLRPVQVFGRVPMFYYLLHIPLVHGLAAIVERIRFGQAEFGEGAVEEQPGMIAGERPSGAVRAPHAGGKADDGEPGAAVPESGHGRVPPARVPAAQRLPQGDQARTERAVPQRFGFGERAFMRHGERLVGA